jgi:hypothetical protein
VTQPPRPRYPRKPLSLPLTTRRWPIGMIMGVGLVVMLGACFICLFGAVLLFRVLH